MSSCLIPASTQTDAEELLLFLHTMILRLGCRLSMRSMGSSHLLLRQLLHLLPGGRSAMGWGRARATQAAKGQRSFFLNAHQKAGLLPRSGQPIPAAVPESPGHRRSNPDKRATGTEAMAAFSLRSCLPIRPTIRRSIIHVVSPMRLLGGVPRNWLGSYAYC